MTIFSPMRNNKGFSLLEVLIALAIMMGSVLVVATAWSGSQLRVRKLKINHESAFLLDYKVAEIERKYKNEITLLPEEEGGTFEELGKDYANFTWRMTSKKFEMPDLTAILSGSKQGADPIMTMMLDKLGEYFNQAVKETTVTIIYTLGKNKISYSASIFLIDFNQQIPIPNLGGAGGGLGGGINGGSGGGGGDDNN